MINHLNIKNFSSSDTKQIQRSNIKGYPGYITYSAKIYLNKDVYYVPLVKIDTGFFVKKNIENAGADLLEKVLAHTAEVAGQSINSRIFEKRHRFTKEELLNINIPYAKQEIPFDTVKGIYLTFDAFLHHRLTKKEFILKLHKHDYYYVYVKQDD